MPRPALRAEMSLESALRDAHLPHPEPRRAAARSLAPALLAELGRSGPDATAIDAHAQGPAVRATLERLCTEDGDGAVQALAATGAGLLGVPEVVDWCEAWLDDREPAGLSSLRRECAAIALGFLGATLDPGPTRDRIRSRLSSALREGPDDLRFQAASALVDVLEDEAQPELTAALEREAHPGVLSGLFEAVGRMDVPSAASCNAVHSKFAELDDADARLEGALVLAGARDARAIPLLTEQLTRGHFRDRALEGLAVFGTELPPDLRPRLRRTARSFWTPALTRVRAAYVLAASGDSAGPALLARLATHLRPDVREAVADANAALRQLGLESPGVDTPGL